MHFYDGPYQAECQLSSFITLHFHSPLFSSNFPSQELHAKPRRTAQSYCTACTCLGKYQSWRFDYRHHRSYSSNDPKSVSSSLRRLTVRKLRTLFTQTFALLSRSVWKSVQSCLLSWMLSPTAPKRSSSYPSGHRLSRLLSLAASWLQSCYCQNALCFQRFECSKKFSSRWGRSTIRKDPLDTRLPSPLASGASHW